MSTLLRKEVGSIKNFKRELKKNEQSSRFLVSLNLPIDPDIFRDFYSIQIQLESSKDFLKFSQVL